MKPVRKRRSAALKVEVALAAINGDLSLAELSRQYGVNPGQVHAWRKTLVAGVMGIFESRPVEPSQDPDPQLLDLHKRIGELSAEINRLRDDAKLLLPRPVRLGMIDRTHPTLSIVRQCRLLSLTRSTVYYEADRRGRHADR